MTFGAAPFGTAPFGAAGGGSTLPPSEVYIRSLALNIIVCAGEAVRPKLYLRERVFARFAPVLPLTLAVHAPRAAPVLPLELTVFGTVAPVLGLALTVNSSASFASDEAYVWAAKVVLGGVDVSAQLTGQIEIDAGEDSARTAHVSLAPTGSTLTMASLARALIAVDVVRYDNAGAAIGIFRLFTGQVDTPSYDASTRVLRLTCTDGRQSKVLAMTRAQIDALVPGGLWSPFVFDRYATSEQYLADRLSTAAGSVDADAFGTLHFTPWAGIPTRSFAAVNIVDGSLQAAVDSTTSRRKTELTLIYRYPQAKVRAIHFRYEAPTLSQMFYLGLRALTRNAVEQALSGSGATVVGSINFMEYPTSALVQASGGMGVLLAAPTAAAQLCMAASATLNRRYSRWIDEQWIVEIGMDGTKAEESRVVSVEWDPTESDTRKPPTNAATGFVRLVNDSPLPYIPERLAAGENVLNYVPAGQPDAAAFALAYKVSILSAAKEVANTHRDAAISFSVALDPSLNLQTFATINTAQVTGGGKVRRVRHLMDITAGTALTDVELSCVGVSLPDVAAPVSSEIPNAIKLGSLVAKADTWIGGMAESRAWDETTMFGYCTNSTSVTAPESAPRYPEQFTAFVPGIEEAAQGTVAVPPTCDMVSGSTLIQHLSSTDGFARDVYITGSGIPANTKILAVDTTGQTATLSNPVTRTAKGTEVRLAVRQYIDRRRVTYSAIITRNGPTIGV